MVLPSVAAGRSPRANQVDEVEGPRPNAEGAQPARETKPGEAPVGPPRSLEGGSAKRLATSPAPAVAKPITGTRADRASADDGPPKPLDPDTARASIAAGLSKTRAQATEAAGVPIDGSGRHVAIIDADAAHGSTVRDVVRDARTGIAPGATTSLTFLPTVQFPTSAMLSDTRAWSGTADPKAASREVKSAQAAVDAGTGTPRDHATLGLAKMAATMRSMKAGTDGEPALLLPLNTGTPVPVQKALGDMLDNPGTSAVAQAARQAVDDWATSAPSDLLKSNAVSLAKQLNAFADKLLEAKNPDPSKAAFVSMSVSLQTAGKAASFAYASLLSPAWRAEHGLGAVGSSQSPEQTQRGLALVEARTSELVRAAIPTVEDPEVVKARGRVESVAQEKLDRENMGVIVSSGNTGNAAGFENLFKTPSILSVGTMTDAGEPFDPSDRTIASFSNAAEIASPGLVVAPSSPGSPPEVQTGTSFAAPHAAGVAALVSQAAPRLSARQVLDTLKSTAVPAKGANGDRAGAGLIDVAAAVRKARGRHDNS